MKYLVTLVSFLLFAGIAQAQFLLITSDSLSVVDMDYGSYSEAKMEFDVINTHPDSTFQVNWSRVQNEGPGGVWGKTDEPELGTSQVCVDGNCFYYPVEDGDFTLAPGDTMPMYLTFITNGQPGIGRAKLQITVDRDNSGEIKFFAKLGDVTSAPTLAKAEAKLQVYPNPARDYILVKQESGAKVERIEVYNMLGLKVLSQQAQADSQITRVDLLDMQKGIYMVRVFDKDNNVVLTKSISKVR